MPHIRQELLENPGLVRPAVTGDATLDSDPGVRKDSQIPLKSSTRIPELDGIRGVAILMVLVWHYFCCLTGPLERGTAAFYASRIATLAWSGVDLFFVLSGCLIGGILLDHFGKPRFIYSFMSRRLFRIAPAYAVLLAMYSAVLMFGSGDRYAWLNQSCIPFAAYCLMIQNFFMGVAGEFGSNTMGISWSLAVEEQFYCLIILLFIVVGCTSASKTLILLGLAAPVLRILSPGFHAYVLLPFRMDALAVGFAISCILRSSDGLRFCKTNSIWILGSASVLLMGVAGATWKGGMGQLQQTFLATFYGVFVLYAIVNSGGTLVKPMRSRTLKILGFYSYGIYLYHQFILGMAHAWLLDAEPSLNSTSTILVTCGSLALTLTAAAISFHVVESPFIAIGKRLSYDRRTQTE